MIREKKKNQKNIQMNDKRLYLILLRAQKESIVKLILKKSKIFIEEFMLEKKHSIFSDSVTLAALSIKQRR